MKQVSSDTGDFRVWFDKCPLTQNELVACLSVYCQMTGNTGQIGMQDFIKDGGRSAFAYQATVFNFDGSRPPHAPEQTQGYCESLVHVLSGVNACDLRVNLLHRRPRTSPIGRSGPPPLSH